MMSTGTALVHRSSVAATEGNDYGAACIHCEATNQPQGTPKFLDCTGKLVVVVSATEPPEYTCRIETQPAHAISFIMQLVQCGDVQMYRNRLCGSSYAGYAEIGSYPQKLKQSFIFTAFNVSLLLLAHAVLRICNKINSCFSFFTDYSYIKA